jgi:hypothetical protein
MQQQISTPVITLPTLVKKEWKPNVGCTINAHVQTDTSLCDQEKASAKASWVNFVAALGLGPEDDGFYHMSTQANLGNGIISMRWAGKDLVGICTMLGYHSYEENTSFKSPMPLPMRGLAPWDGFNSAPAPTVASSSFEGGASSTTSCRPSSTVSTRTCPGSTSPIAYGLGCGGPSTV